MMDYTKEPGKKKRDRYIGSKEPPLVTIITPYYNASKYFEQTFCSVLNQTFPWFEWLIVDDGSVQKEAEFIDCYAGKDQRIRVIHKENGGISTARNLAVKHAKTKLIMPLDADDLIEPQHLECLFWALMTNPEGAWAYSGLVGFGEKQHLWKHVFTSEQEKKVNICIVNSLIRKEALLDVGGYLEITKHYNEDWHLYLRMLAKGYKPVQIEQYSFWYRINNTGVASAVAKDPKISKQNERLIREVSRTVPDGIRSIRFHGQGCQEFERLKKWEGWNRTLCFKKKKIQLLLLIPHMVVGGADKFNYDLLRSLDREKYAVGIITTVDSENVWKQKFAVYTDEIFELPQFLNLRDWPAFIHYYISTRQVSMVLNISSFYSYYLLPWLRMEFPDLGIYDYIHADCKYWRMGGYTRLSAGLGSVLEQTIVANRATYEIMVRDYGKDAKQCMVSYIGTDEAYFDPKKVTFGQVRQKFGIAKDRPLVLFLCRLSHEKRGFLFIEIAKRLRELLPETAFMVVGDGECKMGMQERARQYGLKGSVYFAGNQEDVRRFYRDADVLLICSLKEGLTLTTFEAMAMELAVVSADVGSQGEIVNEQTGALIECLQDEVLDFADDHYAEEEITAYVNALYQILSKKGRAKEIGRLNRKLIKEHYSFQNAVKVIEHLADSCGDVKLLEKRRRQAEQFSAYRKEIEEFLTLYHAYERKCVEACEVWEARCYFKERLEKSEEEMHVFRQSKSGRMLLALWEKYRDVREAVFKRSR